MAGAFSFALFVAFVPGLASPAISPRWAMLMGCVPLVAVLMPWRGFTALHALGLAFLAWCAATLAWAPSLPLGIDALAKLILLGCLFHIGSALPSLRPVYIGAALGLGVNGLVAIAQMVAPDLVVQGISRGAASGLFMNKNHLAAAAALVLVGLIGERLWRYVLLVLPAVILPVSRSAFVALAVAGTPWLWRQSRAGTVAALAAAAAGLWWIWNPATAGERIDIWSATLPHLTWFGHGLGSFYTLFPSHAPSIDFLLDRPFHAHNDWLELAYDVGAGAAICGAFLLVALSAGPLAPRAVFLAFIMEGCFDFPIHLPATVFIAGLAAGHVARGRPRLFDLPHGVRMALQRGLRPIPVARSAD